MTNTVSESLYLIENASGASRAARDKSYAVVEAWHNVTHIYAFRVCTEQPCHAVVRASMNPAVPPQV